MYGLPYTFYIFVRGNFMIKAFKADILGFRKLEFKADELINGFSKELTLTNGYGLDSDPGKLQFKILNPTPEMAAYVGSCGLPTFIPHYLTNTVIEHAPIIVNFDRFKNLTVSALLKVEGQIEVIYEKLEYQDTILLQVTDNGLFIFTLKESDAIIDLYMCLHDIIKSCIAHRVDELCWKKIKFMDYYKGYINNKNNYSKEMSDIIEEKARAIRFEQAVLKYMYRISHSNLVRAILNCNKSKLCKLKNMFTYRKWLYKSIYDPVWDEDIVNIVDEPIGLSEEGENQNVTGK